MRKFKSRIVPILIYAIPVIFFIVSYFLLTASGEDIFQGAGNFANGNSINPIADAAQAFLFNSRITDMYAWSVIDFYDYQFSFGVDTIFRIIDVLITIAVFYVSTYLILDRRPKLEIKDALIFTGFFAVFIVSPFARPFYEEFSMVHNYPPLILATLIFAIPYLKLILGKPNKNHLGLFSILMLLLGFYFGAATTVTPIAFLATLGIYCLLNRKKLKSLPAWFFTGIVGVVVGLFLTQVIFSATNHYTSSSTTSTTFDYIALSAVFENPIASIIAFAKHTFYNFGLVILPLFALYTFFAILTKKFRFYFSKQFFKSLPTREQHFYLVGALFVIIHLLGYTQIIAPFRLLMPPFLVGLILVFRIFYTELNSKIIGIVAVVFAIIILSIHTILLLQYHKTTADILKEIRESTSTDICIDKNRVAPKHIKISNLNQVNIIVDWGFPEIIYGKNITFCEK